MSGRSPAHFPQTAPTLTTKMKLKLWTLLSAAAELIAALFKFFALPFDVLTDWAARKATQENLRTCNHRIVSRQ